jgi:hypothetical protein
LLLRSLSAFTLCVVASAGVAFAQGADAVVVRPRLDNVTRVESWAFFEPPPAGGDRDYTLLSNRAHLGVQVDASRVSFEGSFQYAQLLGLPSNAIGPGPLGPGALYFVSATTPQAYQLYFKSMSLTVKDLLPGLSLQGGRMRFESGQDTPFAGRLIGGAEWTPFERSFDGVRADLDRPRWRAHASFVMPTQGAFEESASPTMGKVQLANARVSTSYGEVFAHNYRDTRAVRSRPDNTGIPVDGADITVQTFGAAWWAGPVHAWGALQRGRWYGDEHRAFSVSADVGHTWRNHAWRPDVRAGVLYASGDDDPNDKRHRTFFPMVPTTRPDLLRGTFAQMNLRDVYGSASFEPRARLRVSADVHHLALAQRQDRWYSGTGATAFHGDYFGFSSRRSTLRTGLGTFGQVSATAAVRQHWHVSGAVGVVRGGDVVRRQFAGSTLWVMALESAVSFR